MQVGALQGTSACWAGCAKTSAVTLAGVSLTGAEAGAITDIANSEQKAMTVGSRLRVDWWATTPVSNARDLFVINRAWAAAHRMLQWTRAGASKAVSIRWVQRHKMLQ